MQNDDKKQIQDNIEDSRRCKRNERNLCLSDASEDSRLKVIQQYHGHSDKIYPQIKKSKRKYVFRNLEQLHSLHPDMDALISLSRDISCNGYHVFTLHPDETPLVHARMFAPANGNPEDPVTGTANGPLGAYLVRFGLIPSEGEQVSFTVIQGEAIRRAGTMEVRVALENGQPGEIQIVGDAVIAFQTTLELEAEQAPQ